MFLNRLSHVSYVKSLFTYIQSQYNMLKISLLYKKFKTSEANNSIILRIKNAKFWRYCFYVYEYKHTNIWEDFQIWISAPLNLRPKMLFWVFLD